MSLLQRRLAWDALRPSAPPSTRLALLSTFTVDPLVPYLGLALHESGLNPEIVIEPYGQILQSLAELSKARFDFAVVWIRLEDVMPAVPSMRDRLRGLAANLTLIIDCCCEVAASTRSRVLFMLPALPLTPVLGLGDAASEDSEIAMATDLREAIRRRMRGVAGVYLMDIEDVARHLGLARFVDERRLALASIPYSEETFAEVGRRLGRLVELVQRPPVKLVVLDADGTLWPGAVGEVGAHRLQLGPHGPGAAHLEFQRYLRDLRDCGVHLAICSKNRRPDVVAALRRPEMHLSRGDFAVIRCGWSQKSEMIASIAKRLGVALSSTAVIDDNPAELAEIGARLPVVRSILMPRDPALWRQLVSRNLALDRLPLTDEDRLRAQSTISDRQRRRLRAAVGKTEYLLQLEITLEGIPLTPLQVPRLEQLLLRTTQFNLTGMTASEQELRSMCGSDDWWVRLYRASDRFGDLGIVGAAIVMLGTPATLAAFLLSCRALGRKIEEAMLADVLTQLSEVGVDALQAHPVATPRNLPARQFFRRVSRSSASGPALLPAIQWPLEVTMVAQADSLSNRGGGPAD